MVDQAYNLRAGDAGPEVKGTAGHVLTFQTDGRVKGEAPAVSNPGGARATWCVSPSSVTFASGQSPGGPRDIVSEVGTFAGIQVGDTIFFPAVTCLVGAFHSGSAAPELGGLYDVLVKSDDQEMTVQRSEVMNTAAKIAAVAIVACDQGTGAGTFQIATPAAAVVDVDPQVHYPVSIAPPGTDSTFALQLVGEFLQWTEVVPP